MSFSEHKLTKEEKKALVAKIVNDCKQIAQKYVDEWKPVDPSWPTNEGCAYLRLSTDKQVMVEKGSLEQQVYIAVSEAEIKSRENKINYRIVRFFIEPGITGKSDKRPEFNAMRDGIAKCLFKFVIAKELSRITRDDMTWHKFMDICDDNECEFVVRSLRLNPRDPIQRHMLNQLAGVASLESAINSKRQKENNHARLTVSKRFNSTHPILGLDQKIENGALVTGAYCNNHVEGKLSEWIFETMFSTESEAITLREIKKKGIKNKNKEFTKASLHKYLTNVKLIAKAEPNKGNKDKDVRFLMPYEQHKLVDMDYEPVIPIKLWNKVQAIIKKNAENLRKNTKLRKVYLLHGLLRLPDGTTFHGTGANGNGGRKNYYLNKAHNFRIDADDAEEGASKAVIQIIKDSEKLQKSIKKHSQSQTMQDLLKSDIQRLKDMIEGLKQEKKRASQRLDILIDGGSPEKAKQYVAEYEKTLERVDTECTKLQARLDTLERSKTGPTDAFYEQFKDDLAMAKHIQKLVANNADPVFIKGAYAKLFKAAVAEPCQETGTYKLRFFVGNGEVKNPAPNGGQGSVMKTLVPTRGLEPPRGLPTRS